MNEEAKRLRRDALAMIEDQVERDLNDESWAWLRTRNRRRGLVLLTFSILLIYAFGTANPFVTLAALVAYGVCLWLLRKATRTITDIPDELVDERMRDVRGVTYRLSYLGTMTLISVYLVIYIGNRLMAQHEWMTELSAADLHDLAFVLFFACMALPSAVFAWREPEI